MKNTVRKLGIIFFVVVMIFTFLSQTIYNLLIPNVVAAGVSSGRISKTVESVGIANATRLRTLRAINNGMIDSVLLKEGDRVEFGQQLIQYSQTSESDSLLVYTLELNQKQNLLAQQINTQRQLERQLENILSENYEEDLEQQLLLEKKQNEIKRIEDELVGLENDLSVHTFLYEAGTISKAEVIEIENQIQSIRVELQNSKLDYELLEKLIASESNLYDLEKNKQVSEIQEKLKDLEFSIIDSQIACEMAELKITSLQNEKTSLAAKAYETSRYEGVISKVHVESGQIIQNSDILFDILIDSNEYEAVFEVSNTDAQLIAVGDDVTIQYHTEQANESIARVVEISSTGKYDNSREVKVNFESDEIMDRQAVTLKVQEDSVMYDFVVDISAVKYDGRNYYVLGVNKVEKLLGSEFYTKKIPVYVIDRNNGKAALSGSSELLGQIIMSSSAALRDNQRVYVNVGEDYE